MGRGRKRQEREEDRKGRIHGREETIVSDVVPKRTALQPMS